MALTAMGCSQPTYKEWKAEDFASQFPGLGGSQPTYKEWKVNPSQGLTQALRGSQPTYKEWKGNFRAISVSCSIGVPSLPTRNGK